MDRTMLMKSIPKPSNKDVIIYDTTLKDLIDVDVFQEYNELLPIFTNKSQEFLKYKNNIENYEKTLNNIYLYKTNWSEEDYLFNLQNDKQTYSNLYQPIKKMESNIGILQKKLKMIDDKIEMQKAKENKYIEDKKNNIDKKINENVDKLMNLKEKYSFYEIESKKTEQEIKDNEEDFLILQKMVENIENGECKCEYCGSTLKNVSKNSLFYKRVFKRILKNKNDLEKLLEKQEKNKKQLTELNTEITQIKQELKNDSNFKAQDFNFYRKKSVEVLKLEASKDSMLNELTTLQEELKNNKETKTKQYIELKERIEKCEQSLENLHKIKTMKEELQKERIEYRKLYDEMKEMKIKMDQYKKFLIIFFKIYEQKASQFCGKDFKFKIFDFENYTLIEKFEIYYKTIEYKYLAPKAKTKVDNILKEKFVFYD